MTSPKQIEANRRNALRSTGPKTPEGKARSCRNAIRHGLTAETIIAAREDNEDYQAFEMAVTADYNAETAVQRELVLRLASTLWRLRRATSIETALFESADAKPSNGEPIASHLNLIAGTDLTGRNKFIEEAELQADGANRSGFETKTELGERFLRLAALPTFPLDRLSRYEYLLWRQARQLVLTLETLRRRQCRDRFPFVRAAISSIE